MRGKVDKSLFSKTHMSDILVVQIYVDDIIFGATDESMSRQEFGKLMQGEFEMSMTSKLTFFLRLQIIQSKAGIANCQANYIRELLRKHNLSKVEPSKTPMSTKHIEGQK